MKKIFFSSIFLSMMMLLTSCFKEIDNWFTNTSAYDGRFSVATTLTNKEYSFVNEVFESWGAPPGYWEDQWTIEDGIELMIFNSAANVEDEIIIDTYVSVNYDNEGPVRIKGKFKITGNPSNFSGQEIVPNLTMRTEFPSGDTGDFFLDMGPYYDEPWYVFDDEYPDDGLPTEAGEEWDAIQLYTRVSLEEGKITPNGETTIGGNPSDGVSLKLTVYHDFLTIESYQTPADTWETPGVPEFAWRIKEGSRKNAAGLEEKWTVSGYRYTGFPEDMAH